MPEPIVVLVHGAWHGAWCWAPLQAELDRRGVPSLAVDLPGHGASPAGLTDLYGDAAALGQVLDRLAGPVLLVGHSYGGTVVTEAAGAATNVAHLVFLTAYCLDEGEAVTTFTASLPPADTALARAVRISDDGARLELDAGAAGAALYHRCPPGYAAAALPRLSGQLMSSLSQPIRAAGWRRVPSTYVVCHDDRAIDPGHQMIMAGRCGEIVEINADHSPFASAPGPTADVLERLVTSARRATP